MNREKGKTIREYAKSRAVKSLDHVQGNSHPISAIYIIFCPTGQIWDCQLSAQDKGLFILSVALIFLFMTSLP